MSSEKTMESPMLLLMMMMRLVFLELLHLASFGSGFNLDELTSVKWNGTNDSYFGFSIAQYVDNATGGASLLVGAPRGQNPRANVSLGGQVLRCRLDQRPNCRPILFDGQGNSVEWNGSKHVQKENKTLQWFGATLVTSKSGYVLACAPRYVHFSRSGYERYPAGSCYLSQSNLDLWNFSKYEPCVKTDDHCLNGFSAAFSSDGNYLITGAVGRYLGQGQLYVTDLRTNDIQNTVEGPKRYDDTYKGYAVASGNFHSANSQDFVVGIPRGNHLTGQILFFTIRLDFLFELNGEQIGEYFGSSLTVADFNGDGRDDVAVGAPLYSPNANQYDIGRVYIFYQTEKGFVQSRVTKLSGSRKALGRFGSSVSAAGDLNLDGFNDLVVGAPYDGPNGRGAVFVFQGSSDGVLVKESQICFAETFDPHLSAFGFSLSGGLDLDKNGYPDLAIGAYKSDSVILLRSRPVVKITAEVEVKPNMIDLEKRICKQPNGIWAACFSVAFCANYSGVKVPKQLRLVLSWRLDVLKTRNQRAVFLTGSSPKSQIAVNTTIFLAKQHKNCSTAEAYIKEKIRDKLSPIEFSVGYSLVEIASSDKEPRPILDIYALNPVSAMGHIKKDCGEDNTCVPDLQLQVNSSRDHYVLGTDDEVNLNVFVENLAEDAFESTLKIEMPMGIFYINVVNVTGSTEVACDAFRPENSTSDSIFCDIGNPLPANHTISFVIRMTTARASSQQTTVLQFFALVNSSNPERADSLGDNFRVCNVSVKAVLNILLTGVSQPQQVLYDPSRNRAIISESDIGPNVSHLFEIKNFGPGDVGNIRMTIRWPSMNYNGRHLFYLLEQPQIISGRGTCWADVVNPLNFTFSAVNYLDKDSDHYVSSDFNETAKSRMRRESGTDNHVQKVTCSDAKSRCSVVTCETDSIKKGESVLIHIRALVFSRTFYDMQKNGRDNKILVESIASAMVTSVPYAVEPEVHMKDNVRVETFVSNLGSGYMHSPLEFWIIAVGIFVGCVLLFSLVVLLWRCGFFERSTRMQMQRGQIRYNAVDDEY